MEKVLAHLFWGRMGGIPISPKSARKPTSSALLVGFYVSCFVASFGGVTSPPIPRHNTTPLNSCQALGTDWLTQSYILGGWINAGNVFHLCACFLRSRYHY